MFDSQFINTMYTAAIIGTPSTIVFFVRYEMCTYDSNTWMILLTLLLALFSCYYRSSDKLKIIIIKNKIIEN